MSYANHNNHGSNIGYAYPNNPGYPSAPVAPPTQGTPAYPHANGNGPSGYPGQTAPYPVQQAPPQIYELHKPTHDPYAQGAYGNQGHTTVHVAAPLDTDDYSGSKYLTDVNDQLRRGFIKKVYSILSLQLAFTFAVAFFFLFNDGVKDYVQSRPMLMWLAFGITFALIICFACVPKFAYEYPRNVICLAIFTAAEAYLVGVITSFYDIDTVVLALGATIVITVALTIYAIQTKVDYTQKGGMLLVLLIGLLFLGFWGALFRSEFVNTLYAALGCVVFGMFIVYDTQRICGGKNRAIQLTVDDYVYAALNLYIDIIQLFLFLLRLLNGNRNN